MCALVWFKMDISALDATNRSSAGFRLFQGIFPTGGHWVLTFLTVFISKIFYFDSGVEICGCDCTLSTEWKSPNKLIARSGPGKGRGQIIITTASGGRGTCTVEFRGYFESIGPLKESAVWVEEASQIGPGPWSKGTTFHIEDPLGLSVEAEE